MSSTARLDENHPAPGQSGKTSRARCRAARRRAKTTGKRRSPPAADRVLLLIIVSVRPSAVAIKVGAAAGYVQPKTGERGARRRRDHGSRAAGAVINKNQLLRKVLPTPRDGERARRTRRKRETERCRANAVLLQLHPKVGGERRRVGVRPL